MECFPKLQKEPTRENIIQALKNDEVGRFKDICAFVNILAKFSGNYVLALNGKWGSGKTFFVKEAQAIIENDFNLDCNVESALLKNNIDVMELDIATIHYDAWMHDRDEDPLASVLDSLLSDERIKKDFFSIDKEKIRKSIEEILKAIAVFFLPGMDKIIERFGHAADYYFAGMGKVVEKNDRREDINNLLPKLFDEILRATKKQKLIFFIDELDRCRPDYAVRLLETIKHYFSYERVSFVLSVNIEQLCHTIRRHYGNDFDAEMYLNRFIDYSFELPEIDLTYYQNVLPQYSKIGNTEVIYTFNCVAKYYHMGFRELLSYWQSVGHFLEKNTNIGGWVEPEQKLEILLVVVLDGMKISDRALYQKFMDGKDCQKFIDIMASEISNQIRFDTWFASILPRNCTFKAKRSSPGTPLVDFSEKFKEFYEYVFAGEFLSSTKRDALQPIYGNLYSLKNHVQKYMMVS